jgi:hypothetical protein
MAKGDTTLSLNWAAKPEWGGLKKTYVKLTTGTSTYATGGYACDLTTIINLGDVKAADIPPVLGYTPALDLTNKKLKFYSAAGTELADASTALNNQTILFRIDHVGV